jgi:hypothetical protein
VTQSKEASDGGVIGAEVVGLSAEGGAAWISSAGAARADSPASWEEGVSLTSASARRWRPAVRDRAEGQDRARQLRLPVPPAVQTGAGQLETRAGLAPSLPGRLARDPAAQPRPARAAPPGGAGTAGTGGSCANPRLGRAAARGAQPVAATPLISTGRTRGRWPRRASKHPVRRVALKSRSANRPRRPGGGLEFSLADACLGALAS